MTLKNIFMNGVKFVHKIKGDQHMYKIYSFLYISCYKRYKLLIYAVEIQYYSTIFIETEKEYIKNNRFHIDSIKFIK